VIGTAVLAVVILAGSWFLLISPVLAEASDTDQQAEQVEVANTQHEARIAVLAEQHADIETYRAELATLRSSIPADESLAPYLRELQALGEAHGVTLSTMAPTTAQAFTPVPVMTDVPVVETATEPADAAPADAAADPVDAVATVPVVPEGMAYVAVSLTAVGGYDAVRSYVDALQRGTQRLMLVQSVSGSSQEDAEAAGGRPATAVGDLEVTISGYLFVVPDAVTPAPAVEETPTPLQGAVPGKNPLVPLG